MFHSYMIILWKAKIKYSWFVYDSHVMENVANMVVYQRVTPSIFHEYPIHHSWSMISPWYLTVLSYRSSHEFNHLIPTVSNITLHLGVAKASPPSQGSLGGNPPSFGEWGQGMGISCQWPSGYEDGSKHIYLSIYIYIYLYVYIYIIANGLDPKLSTCTLSSQWSLRC